MTRKTTTQAASEVRHLIGFRCVSLAHTYAQGEQGDSSARHVQTQQPSVTFTPERRMQTETLQDNCVICYHNDKGLLPETTHIIKHHLPISFLWAFSVILTTHNPGLVFQDTLREVPCSIYVLEAQYGGFRATLGIVDVVTLYFRPSAKS